MVTGETVKSELVVIAVVCGLLFTLSPGAYPRVTCHHTLSIPALSLLRTNLRVADKEGGGGLQETDTDYRHYDDITRSTSEKSLTFCSYR